MKLFRLNNNWLRFRVNKLIRRNHEDLFNSSWHTKISNFKEYTFHRDRWWLILAFVIVVFSIGSFVDLSFLNFIKINGNTAKILVDQRTGNIAAITAITLVVVGFLINNLAVKESFAYRLLFKHSYLYPTIYLTLSTVGCFFIISTLRDQLNETSFKNTVLAGTYLAIVILILIGFLFKTIIEFTNDRTIKKLLHEELMTEAKLNLKVILTKQYSAQLYNQVVTEKGAKEYNWAEALDFAKTDIKVKEFDENDLNSLKSKEQRIGDINVKRILKFIAKRSKNSGQVFYQKMALENIMTEWDNYLWQKDNPNSENDKTFLKKSLVLTKPKEIEKDKESVRKYFDQKLETLANNSEHRDLENILESYVDLYKLQMKHHK